MQHVILLSLQRLWKLRKNDVRVMDQQINKVRNTFSELFDKSSSIVSLETIQIEYLGRKGQINHLASQLVKLSLSEKKIFGKLVNSLKQDISSLIDQKKLALSKKKHQTLLSEIDTTSPGTKYLIGQLHPTTLVIRQINSFFRYLGYGVYDGPEIETDEYNFQKLNVPADHPARELQDTLYIVEPEYLLRTHTSSVETRAMTKEQLPLQIVVPGKVYRNETANATNNSMFYQYEGLRIDKNISMAHLRGTLDRFVRFLYGENTKTRFRCKYYPQVEPGAGMDIQCNFCNGNGCQVCKYRGWIEVLGAGMVHPNVLTSCKIDPEIWSGFAFGMGLDRLVMLKYGIDDVRKLYSGQLIVKQNT